MSETELSEAIRKEKLLEVHCNGENQEEEPDPQ
jgi:hypothetical protein